MPTIWQLNYTLFQDINAHAGTYPWLDGFMIFCANSLIFCWPLLLLIVWGIPSRWRKYAGQPGANKFIEERRAAVLWIGIACLLAYAINLLIEQYVFEPRPFVSHRVHLLISHAADASFPSDHAAWSFAVVGMLLFAFLPLLRSAWSNRPASGQTTGSPTLRFAVLLLVVALIIASGIGLARVYVGVHYPGDILGGAFDGLVAASLATLLRQWLHRPTQVILRFAYTLHIA